MTAPIESDDGPIRHLTLNRPDKLNVFTGEGYRAFGEAIARADVDDDVSVIRVSGAGRAFCAGVDLDAYARGEREQIGAGFRVLLGALAACSTPIVAAVQGPAVGIGATMLLHFDVVVLADDARLRFPFAALGTAPEAASSWLLPRAIGHQRTRELLLTGRWVPADEAVAMDLAARVVPLEELHAAADGIAADMAKIPRESLVLTKRFLRAEDAATIMDVVERETDFAAEFAVVGGLRRRDD